MDCKPKAHVQLECPYCGEPQIHSQAFEPEAHNCHQCQRTFVAIPRIEIRRVEGEVTRLRDTA